MLTLSWTPPPWPLLNFSRDCSLAGDWLGRWYGTPNSPPLELTLDYFLAALPRNTTATVGQITEWYIFLVKAPSDSQAQRDFVEHVLVEPRRRCTKELCAQFDYDGIPDLAGIGVGCLLQFCYLRVT